MPYTTERCKGGLHGACRDTMCVCVCHAYVCGFCKQRRCQHCPGSLRPGTDRAVVCHCKGEIHQAVSA